MLIPINKIRIKEGRRELSPAGIDRLVESMAVVGLLNPISVDESNTLIAGNHRLEAAKKAWMDGNRVQRLQTGRTTGRACRNRREFCPYPFNPDGRERPAPSPEACK